MADGTRRVAALSPDKLQALVDRLKGRAPAPGQRIGPRQPGLDPIPLSFAQERLWFLEQLDPGTALYNVSAAVRLHGRLRAEALAGAFSGLAGRHESLRTTFAERDGLPFQVVSPPPVEVPLPVIDLTALPEPLREAELLRQATLEGRRPLDLARGPLLRVSLLRLGPEDHAAVPVLHHIVSDAWSAGVLIREVAALYEAFIASRPASLPPLPVQYADYAVWQRERLDGQALGAQVHHWRGRLAGLEPLELPTDRPRPPVATFHGAHQPVDLLASLCDGLRDLARREGASLFMALLAAWGTLLRSHTGQDDFAVGSPVANRDRSELEGLIGFFVNTAVLRLDLAGDPSFRDLLVRVREVTLDAYAHLDVPFERLVEELQPVRSLARPPLFQVMLTLQNVPIETLDLPGLSLTPLPLDTGTAKFELLLDLTETGGGLAGELEHNDDLFDAPTVDRLVRHFVALLAGAAADPERRLSELPLLSEAERHQVEREWNDTGAGIPAPCLPQLFAAQAERTPEAVAVAGEEGARTYRELRDRARDLAGSLRRLGVAPGWIVGVCLDRTLDLPAALLGVLEAGGAYLPLDPAYPRERLAFMLEDSGARALVTRGGLAGSLPEHGAAVLDLDADLAASLPAAPTAGSEPDDLAYVLYTSGSTGRPKGVQVPHRALVNFLTSMAREPGLRPGDVLLAVTSLSFDIAALELYLPLLVGARIELVSADTAGDGSRLLARLRASGATFLQATPATWRMLLDAGWEERDRLRVALCGGEALRGDLAARLRLQTAELWNVYGPTETTVWSTLRRIESDGDAVVPIGRPLANTRVHVLDRRLCPLPPGAPGELCLGGAGVARGYLGRPDLTAGRFVPDPFSAEPGARLYRTGDLARHRPDGTLEFLGRADHQVKVRGFRIETGEVEAALAAHPEIAEAVVVARADGDDARLVAYIVTAERVPAAHDLAAGLRDHLRRSLPEHMVPSAFVRLSSLPLTPNRKVDRKALPAPQAEAVTRFVAPGTPVEEIVAAVWSEVLGVPRIGREDDFFALGGHSLLATRVMSRLRGALGVELPLRALFEASILRTLAERIERAREGETAVAPPPLCPMPREGGLPLSFSQQRLWFLARLELGSGYNMPAALCLEGSLDAAVLARALDEIARRHEVLRTTFPEREGRPWQEIAPEPLGGLSVVDLAAISSGPRRDTLARILAEEAGRPFDLQRGPLLRILLVRLGEDEHALAFTAHHIVADAWSVGLFVRELGALYAAFSAGQPSPLPDLPLQYADFAVWQRRFIDGDVLAGLLATWRARLTGAPATLELPTDRPRPPVQTFRGGTVPFHLNGPATAALRDLARRSGTTLFMALLAGFQTLLGRHAGQEDLVVGSPVAGRNRQEIEGLIGAFLNTLPLRGDLSGDPPFAVLLARTREVALEAYAGQDLPFERLVEELQPVRDLARSPLFQVLLVLQNAPGGRLELPRLTLSPLETASGTARFDLLLSLTETGQGLEGGLEYNASLFDRITAERLLAHLTLLLAGAAADPGRRLSELPLLSAAERHQAEVEWNDAGAEIPGACVHQLFARQAERTPEAVAVAGEEGTCTYRELRDRARDLARSLRRMGAAPGQIVGVCLERDPDLPAALLAVLESGGAYFPLDPTYPRERLALMLEDSGARILVSRGRLAGSLSEHGALVLDLDADLPADLPEPPAVRPGPDDLAYVLYTSGSTGRPKGVQIPHRALVNFLSSMLREPGLRPDDVLLAVTSLSFDIAALELYLPLLAGARIELASSAAAGDGARLLTLLRSSGATFLQATPATWRMLLEAGWGESDRLRVALCGGEALRGDLAARLRPRTAELWNVYGPTETTVWSTLRRVESDGDAVVPIGRPLANTRVHVLDSRRIPVPPGAPGELWIGGEGVARGYLGRPDLTAERFAPDPFSAQPGARLYRTGDLVLHRPDGVLEFLGRADHQVKVRGFRIETAEVEAALATHEAVREAVVVARDDGGESRLVAYVVAAEETGARDALTAGLREHLRRSLPEFMVPSAFVLLDSLPLTPNRKVDRKALPAPQASTGTRFVAPRTPVQEIVAGVWSEVLGAPRIGLEDDFFVLGGHSLTAARLIARLRNACGVDLPVRLVFEAPTVEALARRIEEARSQSGSPPPPRRMAGEELQLSFAQERLWFLDLLRPGSSAYNLPAAVRLAGPLSHRALERSLEEVARRHEILRTTFPTEAGRPVPRVAPPGPVPLPENDLRGLPAERREAEIERLAREDADRPFDLAHGPLWRTTLLRVGAQERILLLCLHHIAADAWSLAVLVTELTQMAAAFSRGEVPALPELPLQYNDFAVWQRRRLEGEPLAALLGYWREQLRGPLPPLDLPADGPAAGGQARAAMSSLILAPELTGALRSLAGRRGATLFMTVLSAFAALLGRWTTRTELALGSPVAGRNHTEIEGLIGCFLNTLVLRTDLQGEPSFEELLDRVRGTVLEALAHQDLPFEKLVEELQPQRDPARNPFFDILFNFISTPAIEMDLPGISCTVLERKEREAMFPLTLYAREQDGGLGLRAVYRRDLFTPQRVEHLLFQLRHLLEQIAAAPERAVAACSLVPPEAMALLPDPREPLSAPEQEPLFTTVAAWARRLPEQVAVEQGGRSWTYADLVARAGDLAARLLAAGLQPGEPVAVYGRRSFGLMAAMLGTLAGGGVLLTLDPALPVRRRLWMLTEARARWAVCIGDPGEQEWTGEAGEERRILVLPADGAEAWGEVSEPARDLPRIAPEAPAYLFFTSGTTGTPKGILGRHASLAHFLRWQRETFAITPGDRSAQLTGLSFDVVLRDVFTPLTAGATLCLPEEETREPGGALAWLERERITVLHTVPALASSWLAARIPAVTLRALRWVFFAGEPLTEALVRRWRQAFPRAGAIVNLYGPTETTLAKCCHVVGGEPVPGVQPVGRPLPQAQALVLAGGNRLCGIAEPGEIVIRTPFRSLGYVNAPEEMVRRFVPNPFRDDPADLLYRTGDRGRYRPDGTLEVLGRLDFQVKIRGVRVEPGEVEAVLLRHGEVREAVVVPLPEETTPGELRLAAYVVFHREPAPTVSELRRFLAAELPEALVPSAFVPLDSLPLTPNGKVDRRALPAPEGMRPDLTTAYVAPHDSTEERLAAIWREILQVDDVGRDDNFFDLGGHSLLLLRLQTRLQEELGWEVPLMDLFRYPTVRALAGHRTGEAQAPAPVARTATPGAQEDSIAIIGMAGRFPGARDVRELWRNLLDGVESIVSMTPEQLLAAGVDPARIADPRYVRAAAVLEGLDLFDAAFFEINPREAEILDPQHRLFLECCWEALEEAGYAPPCRVPVGVFAGAFLSTYLLNLYSDPALVESMGDMAVRHGNDKDYLATRVSYKLDLRGPSVSIQTSCSTSLVAVHFACQSLLRGECDMALAGGVSAFVPQERGYLPTDGGILAPDGRCRAFDARAAGTIFGNGAGVVVLKRLQDALRDGDSIAAVIRGSALNNDGADKVGYTAPSVNGQAKVISQALAAAGVDPATIGYVEAHGTGTSLGDPIEIAALTQAYRAFTDARGYCAIGSVKTNVGHLSAAAGVTGLIKAALALRSGRIPPSLHFETPNPKIDFPSTPFFVADRALDWPAELGPRRAGLSSFGMGGTNVHMVLEEPPVVEPAAPARPWQVLVLSARSGTGLDEASQRLARWLRDQPALDLADVAYTLQAGRRRFEHRRAFVCRSVEDAVRALETPDPRQVAAVGRTASPPPVAFLFPGQGAQQVGMGRQLYREEPVFREHVDQCCELLTGPLGLDLRPLLYADGPETAAASERLQETRLAQPALFVTSWALARLWMEWGIRPQALLGHSVGEYVAACLAGVFSLPEALDLVAERGRLMQACPPGAMLAVPLPQDELAPWLGEELGVAAVNAPSLCVVSGPVPAVAALEEHLSRERVSCQRLRTSHAFHSWMMEPAAKAFAGKLREVTLAPPTIPLLSDATGHWMTPSEAVDPAYWASHLLRPVRFSDALGELLKDAPWVLLEVGPGKSLGALVKRRGDVPPGRFALSSLGAARGREELEHLQATVGRLWLAGVEVDWEGFSTRHRRHRISLPTYPFERRRFWITRRADAPGSALPVTEARRREDPAQWLSLPVWRQTPPLPPPQPSEERPRWLVLAGTGDGLGTALAERLERAGWDVVTVSPEDRFATLAGWEELLGDLEARGWAPAGVAHLWGVGEAPDFAAAQTAGLLSLLSLARALVSRWPGAACRIVIFTDRMQAVTGDEDLRPEKAPVLAACKVLPQEYPGIECRSVDVVLPALGSSREARLVDHLAAECAAPTAEPVVAWRGGRRWTRGFQPLLPSPAELPEAGSWLTLGGSLGPSPVLADSLEIPAPNGPGHLREDLEGALRCCGALRGVVYVPALSPEDLHRALADIEPSALARLLEATALDLEALESLPAGSLCLLFSPLASVLGGAGTIVPAAVGALLNASAHQRDRVSRVRWLSLDGEPAEIAKAFRLALSPEGPSQVVISSVDIEALWERSLDPGDAATRSALSAVYPRPELATAYESPASAGEQRMAVLFRELLGVERVGLHDDFFELGGDSLLATQLISRVRDTLQVDLPLRTFFEAPTVAALAEGIAGRIAEASVEPVASVPGLELPLSFAQERLWFFHQLQPESTAYNLPAAIRLEGTLDISALRRTLTELVRRHQVLRSRHPNVDGRPALRIAPPHPLPLPVVDLSGLGDGTEAAALRLAVEEQERPFRLDLDEPLRATLLELGEDDHLLLFTLHHIAADGWSLGIVVRETGALYRAFSSGESPALAEPPIQYADWAQWQRRRISGELLAGLISYWRARLGPEPPVLELPADRPRLADASFRSASRTLGLPPTLAGGVSDLARGRGVTPFMALLAVFASFLGRSSAQEDLAVGSPIAGRTRGEVEGLIGLFVNTLVLRVDLSGDPSFAELLGRVRETALGAYAHQELPFEKLVDELRPERSLGHTPLFQVMFALQNAGPAATEPLELPGLRLRPAPLGTREEPFDLSLQIDPHEGGLTARLGYNRDLFDATTAVRLLEHFHALLAGALESPEAPLSERPILGEGERHQILREWNGAWTGEDDGGAPLVAQRFELQAALRPEAPAVLYAERQVSFGELNRLANRVAHRLLELGLEPGTPVGLCVERSPEMIAGLLGIWKAGGAYLPLDPSYPDARLAFLMRDALEGLEVPVVLSAEPLLARLREIAPEGICLVCPDLAASRVDPAAEANPAPRVGPSDPAYLIYTSGTTGLPKGVIVEHRNLLSVLDAADRDFGFRPGDRMPCLAPFAFDIFLFELLGPLLAGGASILIELHPVLDLEGLVGRLGEATRLHTVPALMRQLVEAARHRGPFPGMRTVFVGGDAVPPDLLADLHPLFPQARIFVLYGPTEATIICCRYEARPGEPVSGAPIGRPFDNAEIRLLDRRGRPVPIGVPGEIWIGGGGVARGYLARPEVSSEKFPVVLGHRFYRSGDLARRLADGRLEFLGRIDQQVKIRGFRIELGEIESALAELPGVREAVVMARGEGHGKRLVAWLVPEEGAELPIAATREALRQRLPEPMIPAVWATVDALPLSPNGKVDRRALAGRDPEPEPAAGAGASAAPRTPAEKLLAGLWAEVLKLPKVGIHDNFFALGGDSILSIQITTRAQRAGLAITPRLLFQHQTVAALAAAAGSVLKTETQQEQGPVIGPVPLSPIQQRFLESDPPEPHHFNQAVLLKTVRPLDPAALEGAVSRIEAHHDALRLRFHRGPDGWEQSCGAPSSSTPLARVDLSALPEEAQPGAIERAAANAQASLDLAAGPIHRPVSFELGSGRPGRLLWVIHHLAVDAVSWRPLLEDLATACERLERGEAVDLPPKTTSFRRWSELLTGFDGSPELRTELAYWTGQPWEAVTPLPFDGPRFGKRTTASGSTVSFGLDAAETEALLQEVPKVYHTQINDALLSALARALFSWTGSPVQLIELEGHGRQEIFPGTDLSRTVGWFTSLFPVLLDLREGDAPATALKLVKEQLRRVPRGGLGWGLLRRSTNDLAALPRPEVSFNYLGQLDQVLPKGSPFRSARESAGPSADPRTERPHLLEIQGGVFEGRLRFACSYHESSFHRAGVERLTAGIESALKDLIAHCRAPEASRFTPSDFPLAALSQGQLDRVLANRRKVAR